MNQIILAKEYGIEENKAYELLGNLPNIRKERDALIPMYDEILQMDMEEITTSKKARELRMKIRDNRIKGIENWHRQAKEVFLKGGQFVDALKRYEIQVNDGMEANLEKIEKYHIEKEAARIKNLERERIKKLEPYFMYVPIGIRVGEMESSDFEKLYNGARLQFEAKKADDERKEVERLEAIQRQEEAKKEAERIEMERKKVEAAKIAKIKVEQEKIRQEQARVKAEQEAEQARLKAEQEKIRKEQEKKQAIIKAAQDAANEKIRKEQEKIRLEKLKIEQEKAEKLSAEREELQKKEIERLEKIKEEKAIKEAFERQRLKERQAPDREKIIIFLKKIHNLEIPKMTTEKGEAIIYSISKAIEELLTLIENEANNL